MVVVGYWIMDGGGCGGGGLREFGIGCGLGIMLGLWWFNGVFCDLFKIINEIKSLFMKYIDYFWSCVFEVVLISFVYDLRDVVELNVYSDEVKVLISFLYFLLMLLFIFIELWFLNYWVLNYVLCGLVIFFVLIICIIC